MGTTRSFLVRIAITAVKGYRYVVSPLLGPRCRFYPSCSEYMIQSLSRFGLVRGSWKGCVRILRCNPFCRGGVDNSCSE